MKKLYTAPAIAVEDLMKEDVLRSSIQETPNGDTVIPGDDFVFDFPV